MRGHLDQWRCADKHLYGLSKAGIILALKLSLLTEQCPIRDCSTTMYVEKSRILEPELEPREHSEELKSERLWHSKKIYR